MEFVIGSKNGLELITSPFSGCQVFSEVFFYFVVHNLIIFDVLIQRLKEVLELFQKLQLVVYRSHFMMS